MCNVYLKNDISVLINCFVEMINLEYSSHMALQIKILCARCFVRLGIPEGEMKFGPSRLPKNSFSGPK